MSYYIYYNTSDKDKEVLGRVKSKYGVEERLKAEKHFAGRKRLTLESFLKIFTVEFRK